MNNPNAALVALLQNEQPVKETSAADPDFSDFFPVDSPFSDSQRSFLNGLFLGSLNRGEEVQASTPLTVLYASQTGTAEALSKKVRKLAAQHGFSGSIAELDSLAPADLATTRHLLVIAATCGEGEPPDNAKSFYTDLLDDGASPLPESLNYSVLGLGDASYAHFNEVATQLDKRFAELGANRVAPLTKCDVDYDDAFSNWVESVFAAAAFKDAAGTATAPVETSEEEDSPYTKNRPFLGTLTRCTRLSDKASAKAVNHIEISLASGCEPLSFEVGDALGVWPQNDPSEVDYVLQLARFSGFEIVEQNKGASSAGASVSQTVRQALQHSLDLAVVTQASAEHWGVDWKEGDQLVDILQRADTGYSPQHLVDGLRSLQPRLYSIASSPKSHPSEVHLTVGEVHYDLHDSPRKGVASTYLGNRLSTGGGLGVYVQKSSHFGLPADDQAPLIMIGPGTGIAPFRAFLEEREARKATGDNWLFFGDQHEATDFLYRDQLEEWQASGLLNQLSLAWSRDTSEKIYVQHLIRQHGKEFFTWLERGAAIYVCGDASRMAADVEAAIVDVIRDQGSLTDADAVTYLDELRKSARYQRDVY